jgi:hypothetical protein
MTAPGPFISEEHEARNLSNLQLRRALAINVERTGVGLLDDRIVEVAVVAFSPATTRGLTPR